MSEATTLIPEESRTGGQKAPARLHALLAEFSSPAELMEACKRVRDAGFTRWDAHSPYPVHGIDECIGIRMTKLPLLVFGFGLMGCLAGLFLQWWTNATSADAWSQVPTFLQGYDFLVSGKPFFSLPANIPIIFELTILFSAMAAGIGMLVFNNLPMFSNPLLTSERFGKVTTDGFFITIEAADPRFNTEQTEAFLDSIGGDTERVYDFPSAVSPPVIFARVGIVLAFVSLIPLGVIAMARGSKKEKPRIHLIQDMDNQGRYKAQQALPIFADGRAMRMPVGATPDNPGGLTVARGDLRLDDHYYLGRVGDKWVTELPWHRPEVMPTESFVRRGENRFNIYCAPCHGLNGAGHGMVNERAMEIGGGWVQASDLRDEERRGRAAGHIFNTISNGIRTMPSYGSQIPPADRWAVVAYVRALQRAAHAEAGELTPEQRQELRGR